VRILPVGLVKGFSVIVAEFYFLFQRQRREVVVQNFLPVFPATGLPPKRRPPAPSEIRREAGGLVAVEGGMPCQNWLTNPAELEIIRIAQRRGCGILFITLHLGNWEHGGLLLNQLGIPLTILSQAEPDDGLTDLRIASRRVSG